MDDGRLTMDELKARYPDEWVLLDDLTHAPDGSATGGRLVWHGSTQHGFVEAAFAIPAPRHIAVVFLRATPQHTATACNQGRATTLTRSYAGADQDAPPLTMDEIKRRFDGQWVLLNDIELYGARIVRARVARASENADEIWTASKRLSAPLSSVQRVFIHPPQHKYL